MKQIEQNIKAFVTELRALGIPDFMFTVNGLLIPRCVLEPQNLGVITLLQQHKHSYAYNTRTGEIKDVTIQDFALNFWGEWFEYACCYRINSLKMLGNPDKIIPYQFFELLTTLADKYTIKLMLHLSEIGNQSIPAEKKQVKSMLKSFGFRREQSGYLVRLPDSYSAINQ